MSQRMTLEDTLRMTNSLVGAIRRAIAEGGHIDAMHEIDALLGIAQSESERCLAEAQACNPTAQADPVPDRGRNAPSDRGTRHSGRKS